MRVINTKELEVGDTIHFSCNGSGRGGHYGVTALVTKVNRVTVKALESFGSYRPGTLWNVSVNPDIYITKVVDK